MPRPQQVVLFVARGRTVADRGVPAVGVVEPLDGVEERHPRLRLRPDGLPCQQLALQDVQLAVDSKFVSSAETCVEERKNIHRPAR